MTTIVQWRPDHRPGYFGRRRDAKHAEFDAKFGKGNWKIAHVVARLNPSCVYDFEQACKLLYEESYYRFFKDRPEDIEYAIQFKDCYDNMPSNIESGLDYMKQEAYSTHIQDIALRNVLKRLGVWFTGKNGGYMQVRSKDTAGARFSPYNVPFAWPELIQQPSLAPSWAPAGTVEDFWQSNKWLLVRTGD